MAPSENDNNKPQGLRRSSRSNFGKLNPIIHKDYVVGDAATRPTPSPKRRRNAKGTPSPGVGDYELTLAAAADENEPASHSFPGSPGRNKIVLGHFHLNHTDPEIPPLSIEYSIRSKDDSPVQQKQAIYASVPIHSRDFRTPAPPALLQQAQQTPATPPTSSPTQVPNQASGAGKDIPPFMDAVDQQIDRADIDTMEVDMYLNLPSDEELVDEDTSEVTDDLNMDAHMSGLDDVFAHVIQQHGENSGEKFLQDRLAAQRRYSMDDGALDESNAEVAEPSINPMTFGQG
ncbi:uncharacterized protein B0J16DRAFT_192110 [Fusarium flagelliforme]|uniref:uncharacterized protein n=1 Tax=Fusarium flagelliforme TaxID=2675880 RepID=UPI001E8DCA03|nr:uncharacterized protein B0J16DRAFT_192110 [Fusarium flagelliforme]KAH7173486.1 hypothetical protein B0J16DRAFT_192110 [Fusarium flagelliforme]